jgi:hypothetical protein
LCGFVIGMAWEEKARICEEQRQVRVWAWPFEAGLACCSNVVIHSIPIIPHQPFSVLMFVNLGDLMTLVVCLALDPAAGDFPTRSFKDTRRHKPWSSSARVKGWFVIPSSKKWWLLKGWPPIHTNSIELNWWTDELNTSIYIYK